MAFAALVYNPLVKYNTYIKLTHSLGYGQEYALEKKFITLVECLLHGKHLGHMATIHRTPPPRNLQNFPENPPTPPSLAGTKIVQLSDLHINPSISDSYLKKVTKSINAQKPDIIALTGDLICYAKLNEEAPRLERFLKELHAPHGCFVVLGNHDYAKYVTVGPNGDYDVEEKSKAPLSKAVGSTPQKNDFDKTCVRCGKIYATPLRTHESSQTHGLHPAPQRNRANDYPWVCLEHHGTGRIHFSADGSRQGVSKISKGVSGDYLAAQS